MRLHPCSLIACLLALAATWLGPCAAQAQTTDSEYGILGYPHHNNWTVGAVIGLTGKAKLEHAPFSLDPTYGFIGRYEHPINTFIVLGAQLGMSAWVPTLSHDQGAGRSTVLDVGLFAKLRYPFSDRFEVYVGGPLGFCVSLGDIRNFGGITDFTGGFMGAGVFGTHIGISPSSGLVLEGGYALHSFTHEVLQTGTGLRYNVSVLLAQPWFLLGFYAHT